MVAAKTVLYNKNGREIHEGDIVLVNDAYKAAIYFDDEGKFRIQSWPEEYRIDSIEIVEQASSLSER